MATGASPTKLLPLLENLHGARGRLDLAGTTRTGAPIFIDYAHTPMRWPRRSTPFGLTCGTACWWYSVAAATATRASVLKWARLPWIEPISPLSPTTIRGAKSPRRSRREILAAAPGAIEVPGRAVAVAEAIAGLKGGDILLIAGKGHETGQIIKGSVIPYSDHDAVDAAVEGERDRA